MATIEILTQIRADIHTCFDLARSIDFHQISANDTNEKAIDGRISGLIGMDEFVTWEATHFGIRQQLTSKITAFVLPVYFRDEQVKGPFKSFIHDHFFESKNGYVIMKDIFTFESPFGIFGQLFNFLVLTSYMRRFLLVRNAAIKDFAESGKWTNVCLK